MSICKLYAEEGDVNDLWFLTVALLYAVILHSLRQHARHCASIMPPYRVAPPRQHYPAVKQHSPNQLLLHPPFFFPQNISKYRIIRGNFHIPFVLISA